MDFVGEAILGALGRFDEENINALYIALKVDIQKRYGADLTKALENLERNPQSKEAIDDFRDELIMAGVRKDKALLTLAKTLLATLNPPEDGAVMGSSGTVLTDELILAGFYDEDEDDEELVIG
jgi:hypothetical protein